MPDTHSLDDLLDFLNHAGERGLLPAATAQSLAVACRSVFGVLSDQERASLPLDDLDSVVKRFVNKRAKEFTPSSLKMYGQRVHRAAELYIKWLDNPANFSVKTRATQNARKKERNSKAEVNAERRSDEEVLTVAPQTAATRYQTGYQTAFPIRPGHVVTIDNIPYDLSVVEAERLAQFVRLLSPN